MRGQWPIHPAGSIGRSIAHFSAACPAQVPVDLLERFNASSRAEDTRYRETVNFGLADSPAMTSRPSTEGSRAVDEYLARVPPKFRKELVRLRKLIRAAAPQAEEVISYRMPAFRQHGLLVYYAAFRDHLSFFVGSAAAQQKFRRAVAPFETGKGTLQFTPLHPLPANLVTRLVRARLRENAARTKK